MGGLYGAGKFGYSINDKNAQSIHASGTADGLTIVGGNLERCRV